MAVDGKITIKALLDSAGAEKGLANLSKHIGTLAKATGLIAFGKAAFNAFEEVEEGANNVIKKTGAVGEAAEGLIGVYKKVSTEVVGDLGDIGNVVGELSTRLELEGDALEDASAQTMKFAKVNGVDAEQAVISVTRMMNEAGIAASEYGNVLDILTKASQDSGIGVEQLAESVRQNGATLRLMGYSTEESIAMLANFEKEGLETTKILRGMRTANNEWAKSGKDARTEFNAFIKGVQDGSLDAADAVELFGSMSGQYMYEAAKNGQLSFDDMFNGIVEGSEGALDQVYYETLNASEKLQLMSQNLKVGLAETLAPIMEQLAPVIDGVLVKIQELTQWFIGLDDGTKKAIGTVAGIALALMAVATVAAPLVPLISGLGKGIGAIASRAAASIAGLLGMAGAETAAGAASTAAAGEILAAAVAVIALGAGVALACVGIALLADAAVNLASAGVPAVVTLLLMVAAVAALAVVLAMLAPVLTAGAVGLLAFAVAVLAVGVAIDLAAQGIAAVVNAVASVINGITRMATSLPIIAEYGGKAAVGLMELAGAGVPLAAAAAIINPSLATMSKNCGALGNAMESVRQGFGNSAVSAMIVTQSLNMAVAAAQNLAPAMLIAASGMSASANMISNQMASIRNSITQLEQRFATAKLRFNPNNLTLPHFSMSGSFDAKSGSVPTVSVSWYKTGGIATAASLVGIGEAGNEAIVPLQGRYMRPFAQAVSENMGGGMTVYINGAVVNQDEAIERAFVGFMSQIARVKKMGVS